MQVINNSIIGHPLALKVLKSSKKRTLEEKFQAYIVFENKTMAVTDRHRLFYTGTPSGESLFLPTHESGNLNEEAQSIKIKELTNQKASAEVSFYSSLELIKFLKICLKINETNGDKSNLVNFIIYKNELSIFPSVKKYFFEIDLSKGLKEGASFDLSLDGKDVLDFLEYFKKEEVTLKLGKNPIFEVGEYKYMVDRKRSSIFKIL